MAATANSNAAGFVINVPNSGGTSWRGIAKTAIGSEAVDGLPEYRGNPGITARVIKKMANLFGARCRISKVITDLPLEVDSPIAFGVTAFCDTCMKCASTCPGDAIPK